MCDTVHVPFPGESERRGVNAVSDGVSRLPSGSARFGPEVWAMPRRDAGPPPCLGVPTPSAALSTARIERFEEARRLAVGTAVHPAGESLSTSATVRVPVNPGKHTARPGATRGVGGGILGRRGAQLRGSGGSVSTPESPPRVPRSAIATVSCTGPAGIDRGTAPGARRPVRERLTTAELRRDRSEGEAGVAQCPPVAAGVQ